MARADLLKSHHLLLTRFNVALKASPPHLGLDLNWLDSRIGIFADWAVRSIRAQTVQPAGWLVFVNAETEPSRLQAIRSITKGLATVVPVSGQLSDPQVGAHVHQVVPKERLRLITTRLDNDDALAPTYVERIAAAAHGWEGFINPINGLLYAEQGILLRRWDFSSPFLSLVEWRDPAREPTTVFSVSHDRADLVARVRQLGGGPMWVQFVHGRNLANAVRGIPYSHRRAERQFGLAFPRKRNGLPSRLYAQAAATELYKTSSWLTKRLTRIR